MPAPSELVNSATSDKLAEVDWAKNIEICELVANDQRQAKDVIKAIKKRLGNKSGNAQLYAVMLLETLMNNIGDAVHELVIEAGLLPTLVKIVKKKSDLPVRERIFLLLDATQTSLGGASGKFPQYYAAYYELVSAGVKFAQRPRVVSSDHPPSEERQNNLTIANIASANNEVVKQQENSRPSSGSSIIEKASAALEVLREVLDAVSTHNPEAAKDEFTLDLVEQCSFQKDRVMHLVMSCRDEVLLSQAIELNEELGRILARHETLISHTPPSTETPMVLHNGAPPPPLATHINQTGRPTWASNHNNHVDQPILVPNHANHVNYDEVEEEEEAEQLSHRKRKGKAHVKPEDEDRVVEKPLGLLASLDHTEMLHRPLIRPLTIEPQSNGVKALPPGTLIPPPPSKHVEREKFFQEKKGDGTSLSGHMRGLSLHSRGGSSGSFSGSITSNE